MKKFSGIDAALLKRGGQGVFPIMGDALNNRGLTLRQHYACNAMQTILAAYFRDDGRHVDLALIAKGAFSMADAMIAAEVQS